MLANLPVSLACSGPGSGKERSALFGGIAMNKIKYPVRAGTGAVDEVGPRHRTLRGNARAKSSITPHLFEPCEVAQQPLLHEPFRQTGIHAVEAYYDNPVFAGEFGVAPLTIYAHAAY